MSLQIACLELIEMIKKDEIKNQDQLEFQKVKMAAKYSLGKIIKNADIALFINDDHYLHKFLKTKPIRTGSGVANIAVMWKSETIMPNKRFFSCPAECVYCPQGIIAPKSYTGVEPTTMRAIRNDYDPWKQVTNRIKQLKAIGHATDKCELIIMGGTFTAMPFDFQKQFVKRCFDAFNEKDSQNLEEAQEINETSKQRCVGLTIETRSDYCYEKEIKEMLELGCTRVEIGIQSTSDRILEQINRGNTAKQNIEAIKLLKDSGLKFCAHWMPGLTGFDGIDLDRELSLFKELFENENYMPDELKIYPTLVIPETKLYELWKEGKYEALTTEKMISLLVKMKSIVPTYVRIKRIMRDISEHESVAGASKTNLRQLVVYDMEKQNLKCRCIRCREIGVIKQGTPSDSNKLEEQKVDFNILEYKSSGQREFFISLEDKEKDVIHGFLRLRLCGHVARIRELHVYGEMSPIFSVAAARLPVMQHKGLGKMLMKKAEELALQDNCKKITVTSGIGVKEYYKKLGYVKDGFYMSKYFK